MKILICASIPVASVKEAAKLAEKAVKQKADLIEFRLDYFKGSSLDVKKLVETGEIRKIATNRLKSEGGKYAGKEEDRIKILIKAAEEGFELIDLELKTRNIKEVVKTVKNAGAKPLISFHNLKETPSEDILKKIYEREVEAEAEICKIVTKAKSILDNVKIFNLLKACRKPLVCFAMGRLGVPSRVLSPIFGGAFTYACVDQKFKAAPGQFTIQEMRKIYDLMGLI
ncbi:type I 3-dehydroquinate dehydratase [Candidatus Bathyarchaeota archaeon]|nr:type I 3-dehydroquinate dehydratase [Candidatus Bathyarchaeota archaeon]